VIQALPDDDDLTNGRKVCAFNPDEVFGMDRLLPWD
jgi:hypothetical protein